ncbi:DUF917 domain-containing protein [Paraglaciecola polaris]|uniref:DUF917 domain-containing protein n=1 Tax=Paraglaciecola polaris LMG 21857 TaxID=1129793 RepID=K6ZPF5_9ALTE|nr:DUF917 domain-containing protein [Paraglaciecola polaris]GAC32177.1 hypothetical protein GPLA_1262 [Paraglaciecola polaris LMG 21857]|tara:strand:+ start:545 stop:1681 length:1137 start_codon:yes stop_codon:yes gene_type:complete
MKELTREDISDILYGCAILGTGGGGELSEGFGYIDAAIAAGKTFTLVDLAEVPAGQKLCTPYMLGALTPISASEEQEYSALPRTNTVPMLAAYERLKALTGDDYYGTICCELGGANTAISFYLAAMSGGFIIDADPAGRAVPEITHSTYYFNGLPAAPIVAANEFGECFVCENVVDDLRAERVVRALAMVSRNDIAAIDHALPVEQLKGAVIPGTISKALKIGQTYRLAVAEKRDIADAIAHSGNGYVAFRGQVNHFDFTTENGFTLGTIDIQGEGQYSGSTYAIEVKNENLLARINGEIDVTIPDLICCLDLDENVPITNPNHKIGMNIAVVILPAPKEFTGEKGLAAFGPAYLGLADAYRCAVTRHFAQRANTLEA